MLESVSVMPGNLPLRILKIFVTLKQKEVKLKQRKGLGFLSGLLLLLMPLMVVATMGCTKGNYDAFFEQLSRSVPLEEVRYRLAQPEQDTVITWYAPYRIFENRTEFARDSIFHQERFNWQGLGDFLWEKYQERKERKASKRQENSEQTYNSEESMKITKDFLRALYERSRDKIPGLSTIDEWRNQVAQLKQRTYKDYPVQFPALFFQVLPIDWEDYENGTQRGDCRLRVHITQESYTLSQAGSSEVGKHLDARHDLAQKVYEALAGFEGVFFSKLKRVASELDEDPSDIIADSIDFVCTLTDGSEKEAEEARFVWVSPDLIPSKTNYLENNG